MLQHQEILLASTSSARRQLMDGLGVPYRAVAPGVDEVVPAEMNVRDIVTHLAVKKARAVLAMHPSALVIGADQLVSLDGRALGKPDNASQARTQLQSLCGRQHEILTGVCIVSATYEFLEVDVARLSVRELSESELTNYVALGEWEGCAGSYRVEGRGQALFSSIDGDRTSVQGLPMQLVVKGLLQAGVSIF